MILFESNLRLNVEYLKKYKNNIYEIITQYADTHKIFISESSEKKKPQISFVSNNKIFNLHGRDSNKEISRIMAEVNLNADYLVLFGMGNGKILKKISYAGFKKVYLIEPSINIFKANLMLDDFTDVLSEPNLEIILSAGLEDYRRYFNDSNLFTSMIATLYFPAYRNLSLYLYSLTKNFFHLLTELAGNYPALLLIAEKFLGLPYNSNLYLQEKNYDFSNKSVLLIQLSSIGDVIYTAPVIYGMKKQYPGIKLSLLVDDNIAPIMKKIPFLTVIEYSTATKNDIFFICPENMQKAQKKIEYIKQEIKDINPDVVFNLHTSFLSAVIVKILNRDYIGFIHDNLKSATVAGNSFMLARFGSIVGHNIAFEEAVTKETVLQRCAGIKGNLPLYFQRPDKIIQKKIFGIMPGANSIVRRWPEENFAALINMLGAEFPDYIFYLFGGKKEIDINARIILQLNSHLKIINFAGEKKLAETFDLIAECSCFISNDTGLAHIAAALGLRVTVVQGMRSLGGNVFSPNSILISSLFSSAECNECNPLSTNCVNKSNRDCFSNIKPEVAFDVVKCHNRITTEPLFAEKFREDQKKNNIEISFYKKTFFSESNYE